MVARRDDPHQDLKKDDVDDRHDLDVTVNRESLDIAAT